MIRWFKSFWRDEVGSLTPGFLLFFMGVVIMFGAAMNVKDTRIRRNQIESVAQAIALELIRGINNPEITRDEAVQKAFQSGRVTASIENLLPPIEANMQLDTQPSFLEDLTSITYGYYDPKTLDFVEDPSSNEAVMIEMEFSKANGNALRHRFYDAVDLDFDMIVRAVGQAYVPNCSKYGIFANYVVSVSGKLELGDDTCLRSNFATSISAGVSVEPGAIVSAPSPNLMVNSAFQRIPSKAMQFRFAKNKELYDFDRVFFDFQSGRPTLVKPKFDLNAGSIIFDAPKVLRLNKQRTHYLVSPNTLRSGWISVIRNCPFGRGIRLNPGDYRDFVIISECPVQVTGQAELLNGILMSNSTRANGIEFFGNAHIGEFGLACGSNNGVLVWSRGGIVVEGDLRADASQVIAGALDRDPTTDPFNPETALDFAPFIGATITDDTPSAGSILVGGRSFLFGSSLTANFAVFSARRTVVSSCGSRPAANRYFKKYFRVALI